jgi:predicted dehydrogenase
MTAADEPMRDRPSPDAYALVAGEARAIAAPALNYAPPMPRDRSIGIGLIGAGGIAFAHLDAYRKYGLRVVAICDRHLDRAQARRDAFFPAALATDDLDDLIGRPDIPVLDITPHPADRLPLMRRAIEAGHHVLSQKPFVQDLKTGRDLVALAQGGGVQLAVNQNGRWAPHLSWMREAVGAGLIGRPTSAHIAIDWDHSFVKGTRFADMPFLILDDFAIHWFDFLVSVIGEGAEQVFATAARASNQSVAAPLLSQALVSFPGGQASLTFNGATAFGASDTTVVVGGRGALQSAGPDLGRQTVRLYTAEGVAQPKLEGQWFNDGFAGTMGALLCAVETGVEPIHSARRNLAALRLSQAAIESASAGLPVRLA